jgi:CRP-like cAMP-binding protein
MNVEQAMRASPLFDELTADEVAILARVMVERSFGDGQPILREGDLPSASREVAFLVVDGQVEIVARGKHIAALGPGDLFGLAALIDDGPRSATCAARGPVRVAGLGRQAFTLLQHTNTHLATRFHYLVARRLAQDVRRTTESFARATGTD